jgi:hypothetical protein
VVPADENISDIMTMIERQFHLKIESLIEDEVVTVHPI